MLQYCSLFSGSSGNSFFIQNNDTNILVDSGVSARKIISALKTINIDINSIDAILVTHEHVDHINSIDTLSIKYNIPVYANKKTWDAMEDKKNKIKNKKIFNISEKFKIGSLQFFPFSISHDAAEPCGFKIFDDKRVISIATDLGYIDSTLFNCLAGSSDILLESNHETELLKLSSYPYLLKRRISGPLGHLSNDMAGDLLLKLIDKGLKNVLLVHLSKENNFPQLAYKTVEQKLIENNYSLQNLNIGIAPRNHPSEMYKVI